MKPDWKKITDKRFRVALLKTGHTSYRKAMREFEKLVSLHARGLSTKEQDIRLERLQIVRRLNVHRNPDVHNSMIREAKIRRAQTKEINRLMQMIRNAAPDTLLGKLRTL